MPILREITLQTHDNLESVLFPVELVKSQDLFPDYKFSAITNNLVLSTDDHTVIAVHPNTYRFESNVDFMLPVIDKMERLFGLENLSFEIMSFDKRQFFVDIKVNEQIFEVIKNDTVVPMVSLINSYDGSIKQGVALSYYRQICSNGLKGFAKVYEHTARHVHGSVIEPPKRLFKDLESAATMIDQFRKMADRRLLPDELEQMIEYVKNAKHLKFPKRKLEEVPEIASREARELGVGMNAWLAYNAFNNVLNHSDTRLFPHEKAKIDKNLLSVIEMF